MARRRSAHPTLRTDCIKMNLDITEDGDTGRPKVPLNPTLVLPYVGNTVLGKPGRITPTRGALPIGRAVDADVGIRLDDKRVSRLHAVVQCDAHGQLRIVDAGSHNGTYVNGRTVEQASLQNGDVVRLGDSLFIVRYESAR